MPRSTKTSSTGTAAGSKTASVEKKAPVKPAMVKPAVAKAALAKKAVVKPAVVKPAVVKSAVAEPAVAEPAVAEPAVAEPAVAKTTPRRAPAKVAAATANGITPEVAGAKARSVRTKAGGRSAQDPFLVSQREALLAERGTYLTQAEELQAQADSLALEHEPGDVQFDEEGGEGGTSNVDRELDLLLSGQARANIDEIDRALVKMDVGTYGRCEQCGQPIPEARLEALPHASLCVVCKAGGLSSRR